jgi:hypothetical protein
MSYLNLAPTLARAGDQDGGRKCLQKGLDILEPLAAANPDHPKIQRALGKAYELRGGTLWIRRIFLADWKTIGGSKLYLNVSRSPIRRTITT